MKKILIAIILAGFSMAYLAPQVFAAGNTYKRVMCSPDDYKEGEGKKCLFKFKLKKLQTKEFRGHCSKITASGKTKNYQPTAQDCRENNKANSCTVAIDPKSVDAGKKYKSCSCTNWDVTTSHNVKVMVNCNEPA